MTKKQTAAVEVIGIGLLVTYRYEPGSPGTQLDPPEPEGFELYSVALRALPEVDLLPLLEDGVLSQIDEHLWAEVTAEQERELGLEEENINGS